MVGFPIILDGKLPGGFVGVFSTPSTSTSSFKPCLVGIHHFGNAYKFNGKVWKVF